MTPPELRALLADSLAVWGVEARAEIAEDGVRVAGIGAGEVGPLLVTPADQPPIRWWLTRADGTRRPCTSVLGLLRSLRNALGGGETRRLRGA